MTMIVISTFALVTFLGSAAAMGFMLGAAIEKRDRAFLLGTMVLIGLMAAPIGGLLWTQGQTLEDVCSTSP